jgi:hypothetical protein
MGWPGRAIDAQGLYGFADGVRGWSKAIGTMKKEKIRKIRRSFTLSVESVAFAREKRKSLGVRSDSKALEFLLREAMLEMKRQAIDAAVKEYYDTATEEELAEQREWAEMVGPNILIAAPDL